MRENIKYFAYCIKQLPYNLIKLELDLGFNILGENIKYICDGIK